MYCFNNCIGRLVIILNIRSQSSFVLPQCTWQWAERALWWAWWPLASSASSPASTAPCRYRTTTFASSTRRTSSTPSFRPQSLVSIAQTVMRKRRKFTSADLFCKFRKSILGGVSLFSRLFATKLDMTETFPTSFRPVLSEHLLLWKADFLLMPHFSSGHGLS